MDEEAQWHPVMKQRHARLERRWLQEMWILASPCCADACRLMKLCCTCLTSHAPQQHCCIAALSRASKCGSCCELPQLVGLQSKLGCTPDATSYVSCLMCIYFKGYASSASGLLSWCGMLSEPSRGLVIHSSAPCMHVLAPGKLLHAFGVHGLIRCRMSRKHLTCSCIQHAPFLHPQTLQRQYFDASKGHMVCWHANYLSHNALSTSSRVHDT